VLVGDTQRDTSRRGETLLGIPFPLIDQVIVLPQTPYTEKQSRKKDTLDKREDKIS
jgi:hypothetical protein